MHTDRFAPRPALGLACIVGGLAVLVAAAGCGGDKPAPSPTPATPGATGAPSTPSAATSPVPAPAPGGGWDAARIAAVLGTSVEGYETLAGTGPSRVFQRQAPLEKHARLHVRVQAAACTPFSCPPLDVAAWAADDARKAILPPVHKHNPSLVWKVFEVPLAGARKGVGVYALSYVEETTPHGTSRMRQQSLWVSYHDGRNLLELQAYVHGGEPLNSTASMEARAGEDTLRQAAQDVFAGLAKHFSP